MHLRDGDRLDWLATDVAVASRPLARTGVPTLLVAVLVASLLMLARAPLLSADDEGWSLTATPTRLPSGAETTVSMRFTDTDGSGDIGCLRLVVPAQGVVVDADVVATSAPTPWAVTVTGSGPTTLRVSNPDGNGKLKQGDWVDLAVRVRMEPAGT